MNVYNVCIIIGWQTYLLDIYWGWKAMSFPWIYLATCRLRKRVLDVKGL